MICRWGGGNNAGHTIYIDGNKYKTHLIPGGVFYNIPSIIGPDCVVNQKGFIEEINYLKECGFNTDCIKISPRAHVISDTHIEEDIKLYRKQGSSTGIINGDRQQGDHKWGSSMGSTGINGAVRTRGDASRATLRWIIILQYAENCKPLQKSKRTLL